MVLANLRNDDDVYIASTAVVQAGVIPNFIDPLTYSKTKTPAISPYDYVCEYETWTKVENGKF